jgi:hypothetical protein
MSWLSIETGVHVDELGEHPLVGDRRVGQAVDADKLGRHALADLRLVPRIGKNHQPGVAMEVDESRRNDLALRPNEAPRPPDRVLDRCVVAQHDDPGTRPGRRSGDPDRAPKPGCTGPVDDRAVDDQQLVVAVICLHRCHGAGC